MPQAQLHPKPDDGGRPVMIRMPSTPSSLRAWKQAEQIATVLPGGNLPTSLHRVPFQPWIDAIKHSAGWETLTNENLIEEPVFRTPTGLAPAAGVIVTEADGRVRPVGPTNPFRGYRLPFPKSPTGRKSLQATALCEAYEESGLRVRLLRYLVDVRRSQTFISVESCPPWRGIRTS